jgi:uncharacterized membrane protein (DUF441 family)
MKDWKTTLAGIATIVGGLCGAGLNLYHNQPVNTTTLLASITAGVGLIHASDSK